jgi:hypothetical protein
MEQKQKLFENQFKLFDYDEIKYVMTFRPNTFGTKS